MTKLLIHRDSVNTHPEFVAELEAAGGEVVIYDDYVDFPAETRELLELLDDPDE